jgi:hypothetical protein
VVCVVAHCDERRAGIDPQLRGRRRRLIFLILLLVFLLILDELLFPLVLDVVENVAVGQVLTTLLTTWSTERARLQGQCIAGISAA